MRRLHFGFLRVDGSGDQPFEQRDRRRLALGADRGEEHALRPAQRRPAFLVLDVEARAALHEQLDDVVRAAVRGAEQRRQAHRVGGVDVGAELETELDRVEPRLRRLGVGLRDRPS